MAGAVTAPDEGSRAVVRSATGMGAAAAVSRVVGGGRVLVIAAVLGTTYLGNAFQSSNTVSNILFELLAAGALSAVLVPTFVSHLDRGDQAGAQRLAGELLGVTLLVLGAVTVVAMAAAPWLADLLTTAVEDPTVAEQQQQLTTYLLWWFIPQVVLYGVGAIATAVLHARRSFVVPAMAPIGNTVVMVAFLFAFAAVAGPDPGLELTAAEITLLGLGGTLGVLAFVAAPTIAVWRGGFRLVPRFRRTHEGLGALLRLSGWASVQHGFAALLYGAAIIAGAAVEGGVVAYQVGWFLFLAPYGIIAQPIHTTILPELVDEHAAGDTAAFSASLRWAADSMAVLLVPLSALCVALAVPAMTVVAFGQASGTQSVDLLAAALASLGLGLLPYGMFFLLARAFYVLGDSRAPALWGAAAALVGVAAMLVAGATTASTATVVALGLAHSLSYLLGCAALLVALHRRTGVWALPSALPGAVLVATVAGAGVWALYRWWSPSGRLGDLLALALLVPLAAAVYLGGTRLLGISVTQRLPRGGAGAARGAVT
jgi:putative peptidoglycan lipid II flippase